MVRGKGKGRGFLAGRETHPESPLEWGKKNVVPEASRVVENLGEDCQEVVGRGVEFPRGNNTPVVEELPRGDKNFGVILESDDVPGADG